MQFDVSFIIITIIIKNRMWNSGTCYTIPIDYTWNENTNIKFVLHIIQNLMNIHLSNSLRKITY